LTQLFLTTLPRSIHFVDYQGIDWNKVKSTHYSMYQRFRYEYPGPIKNLHQRLMVIPPDRHGNQVLNGYKLHITNPDYTLQRSFDSFGNVLYFVDVPQVEDCIDFEIWCSVERKGRIVPPLVSPELAKLYLKPSPLTTPCAELEKIAAFLTKTANNPLQLADNINAWVYKYMQYGHGVTSVATTAAQAFAVGKGLCQDYSHIMIALCRLVGIPARYVSGHMLGEGGSHAWVEVMLVSERTKKYTALAYDPTNNCRAALKHITIATGRDYQDVSPTSGYYTAPYSGSLISSKQAGLITVKYANGEVVSVDEQFLQMEESSRKIA
jgi:transglutaminase-like putative cysteine protease